MGGSALLWIATNWPQPEKLMLFAFTPAALGALVPQFPMKALLRSLIYGPLIAAVLYFGIMPPLADMWQLAPFLILALFPCCYFVNSPNPATSITAMMSAIWVLELTDLSQGQVYLFSSYAEGLIAIIGAVLLAVTAISLLDAAIPDGGFATTSAAFLRPAKRSRGRWRRARPANPPRQRRSRPSRLMEQLRMCHMWWTQLDPDRFSEDERHKAALLMAAMRSLAFRQDPSSTRGSNFRPPSAAAAGGARRGVARAGATRLRHPRGGRRPMRAGGTVPAISELAALMEPGWQRFGASGEADPTPGPRPEAVLVLIGLHHALVYAVHQCHERFNALDWRPLGRGPFLGGSRIRQSSPARPADGRAFSVANLILPAVPLLDPARHDQCRARTAQVSVLRSVSSCSTIRYAPFEQPVAPRPAATHRCLHRREAT